MTPKNLKIASVSSNSSCRNSLLSKISLNDTNSLLNGQTSITNSEDFFVLISEQSFLSKYGLFVIGGVSGLIVTFVILSFVIRRKRKFYL